MRIAPQAYKEDETSNWTLRDWARQWSFLELVNITFVPAGITGILEALARSYSVHTPNTQEGRKACFSEPYELKKEGEGMWTKERKVKACFS